MGEGAIFLEREKWKSEKGKRERGNEGEGKGLEGVNGLWFLNYSENGVEMKRNRLVSQQKNNRPSSSFFSDISK